MTVLWLLLAAGGLAVASVASSRGVGHSLRAAGGLGVPPFVLGFTLLAIGTDVPEIANSIVASVGGHGDVNVGDSVGSAVAQATLVLGVVPFAARRFAVSRRNVGLVGGPAVLVLLLGALLVDDGHLGRLDAILLLLAWVVAMVVAWRRSERPEQPELPLPEHRPGTHVLIALGWLVVVAAGATLAVTGITEAAEALDVPEFLLSYVGLALGTSLPELTVCVTAARQGRGDLAIGDALGATLADASLSLGSGPLVAPTLVTADLAVRGSLLAAGAVAIAVGVLVATGRHDRWTGTVLVLAYVGCLPLLVGAA